MTITYSECVFVTFGIQHAMRTRRIMLSSVACLVVQYFSVLPHKRTFLEKKSIEHKLCFDFLYNFYPKLFSF
jgi:hypothetical protein